MAGVIHKASIIAVFCCWIFVTFSEENDDQRLARQLSQFAKFELLVPGVATTTVQSDRAATTGVMSLHSRRRCVVEIYLDVGNPSICQSPFSEDRAAAGRSAWHTAVDIDTCHAS